MSTIAIEGHSIKYKGQQYYTSDLTRPERCEGSLETTRGLSPSKHLRKLEDRMIEAVGL